MTTYNPMRLSQPQRIRLVQIFSARLVLEVFGGAGAIWGCSEAVGLRNATNVSFWRPLALTGCWTDIFLPMGSSRDELASVRRVCGLRGHETHLKEASL
eukprot:scaffold75214_cov31-Attheya_sp.AAC.1